ncbi:MAG: hypothetical protein ACRC92_08550 [Peptostreptococcaceae bacterium]
MLNSTLPYVLLRMFPECLILLVSGFILLDIKINKNDLFKYAILQTIIVWVIRSLPINFGVHTILSMLVYGTILLKMTNFKIMKSMITMCQVWIALILSEGIYIIIATEVLGIDFVILSDNTSLQGALSTLPSLLIIVLIAILFKYIQSKIKRSVVGS